MGRPQEFDTAQVVRAAREVFWAEGFQDAAMPDLEAATGLCRSSIYHAFGSKRGLFDAAITNYLDEVVRPKLRPLMTDPVAASAVTDYLLGLRAMIEKAQGSDASGGCLLVNTATSALAADPALRQIIADYRSELDAALLSGLRARHPHKSEAELAKDSHTCTGLIIAALSITKADPQGALSYLDLALATVASR
ncbi:MAG TPA: TetR/AcrR family transcriptional regulator [Propionibacteriaceae bacterium]|nr:TetR/AcrR family transcriptional regulator [Propionibacteriaceae bacterium]